MSDIILTLEHIDRTYTDEENPNSSNTVDALRDINLEIRRGEFISIIGASGCGKTTLLRLIGGLDRPQAGRVLLNGRLLPGRIRSGAMFFSREAFFHG